MSKMFAGNSLKVLVAGVNIFLSIAVGEPACYARKQVDELNVKVTRVPCDEEEHKIFQRFDFSGDVTMTDLLDLRCKYEDLPKIPHGSFKIRDCSGRKVHDTCGLTCDNGYTLTSASVETTCQDKGNNIAAWSLEEFSCHSFTCPFDELPKVSNGSINMSDCSGNTGNDVCSVTCEDDHHPAVSHETVCEYNGTQLGRWHPANLSCLPITCPFTTLPSVMNGQFDTNNCSGNLVHDTCNITCDVNFYTSTMKKTTCENKGRSQGKWTEDNFTCDAISCPFNTLPSVKNGYFDINNCSGNFVHDTCDIICDVNYYTTTTNKTTCQNIGSHVGVWTDDDFSCDARKGWTPWKGHNYIVAKTYMDWNAASNYCSTLSAHLVYINDADENSFVTNMMTNAGGGHAYIGLIKSAVGWKWPDYTYEHSTQWQDEHLLGSSICPAIYGDGSWHDHGGCSSLYSVICESELP